MYKERTCCPAHPESTWSDGNAMGRMLGAGRGFCRLDSSTQVDTSGTLQVTVSTKTLP